VYFRKYECCCGRSIPDSACFTWIDGVESVEADFGLKGQQGVRRD